MGILSRWLQRRRDDADRRVFDAVTGGVDFGLGIVRATGLRPARVYPALRRLERAGRIRSEWEELAPDVDRPRRRLYRRVWPR